MITPDVVEAYTQGRLEYGTAEMDRVIAAELEAARNYCGWPVTPVVHADRVVIDGPGTRVLVLPTLKLVTLSSLIEDGVELLAAPISPGDDSDVLRVSDDGRVEKVSGGAWTRNLAGITAVMTHGHESAPAFDSVVLAAIDRASQVPFGGPLRAVGPFQYSDTAVASAGSPYTIAEQATLDRYRRNGTFA